MGEENELTRVGRFDVKPCDTAIDLTDGKRFTKLKLTRDQRAQVNALLGAAPSLLGVSTLSQSYVLSFPEGVQGTLMRLKRGGYSTTLQNPETGQIVGTAALEQTAIQAACLGAFTAMSIASGQYFLAEINGKLNMMRLSLDKILEFLYGDKRAELLSEISFIRFAYENYGSIMEHEQQRLSTIVSLQSARKVAMKDIEFYLADLVSTVTAKVQTDILETVEKATQIKDSLELSTQLYVMSELLEVFYSENYDDGFLRYIEEEATAYINKCDKRMLTSFSMLQQALTSHKDGIFKKTDKRNPSNLFQFHNPLIYHKTNADSILGMAISETSAPQETLTQGSRQCHTVGKVQFHLQRQGTAVHKGIAVFQSGPVIEFFIGPVYRLISGQCRSSKIEEEHFSRIGKEIQVISTFCRKLRRRDGHMTVTVFHMQVFRSIYPFVPAFGIT